VTLRDDGLAAWSIMEKTSYHVLIVEDDPEISAMLAEYLARAGFRTTRLDSGRLVGRAIAFDRPDLVILDLMLPGEDGFSIARRIRTADAVPIIMLTALGEEEQRIAGLDVGADDYVTKPFSAPELLARIRAILRRTDRRDATLPRQPQIFMFDGFRLDTASRDLCDAGGGRIDLTTAEFELLRLFCEQAGSVLSRDQIARLAQGRRVEPYDRSIDTLVSRLRAKIEPDSASPALIKTVRHGGYIFVADVSEILT
jgi:two-component system OmpR family response regulator